MMGDCVDAGQFIRGAAFLRRWFGGFDLIRDNIRSVDNFPLFVSFYFYNEKKKQVDKLNTNETSEIPRVNNDIKQKGGGVRAFIRGDFYVLKKFR